jgi:hypothetical protein
MQAGPPSRGAGSLSLDIGNWYTPSSPRCDNGPKPDRTPSSTADAVTRPLVAPAYSAPPERFVPREGSNF